MQGLWHGPEADRIVVTGADRARFLNGYLTCDVKSLAVGSGTYGFLTSTQGRVLADVVVLAFEDRLVLEAPAGRGGSVTEHLARYVIADRVEIAVRPTARAWTLVGAARRPVEALADAAPWAVTALRESGEEAFAFRRGRMGLDAWTIWSAAVEEAWGAENLRSEDLEPWRVAAEIGRFGIDFDETRFPQETGAESEAVSYTKGCYLGQEIVARLHYRGQAQNGLRRLRLEPGGETSRGRTLRLEDREVGRLTSVAIAPVGSELAGQWIGLAVLHRRAFEPGTRLETDAGGVAEVLPLLR